MNVTTSKLDLETVLGLTCGTCGAPIGPTDQRCTNCGAESTQVLRLLLMDVGVPWWITVPSAIVSLPWGLLGSAAYRLSPLSVYRRLAWLYWLGCPLISTHLHWNAHRCDEVAAAGWLVHSKINSEDRAQFKTALLGRVGHEHRRMVDDLLDSASYFDDIEQSEKDATLVRKLRAIVLKQQSGTQSYGFGTVWRQLQATCDQFDAAFPEEQLDLIQKIVDQLDQQTGGGQRLSMPRKKELVALILKRRKRLLDHPSYLAEGDGVVIQWIVALLGAAVTAAALLQP